MLQRSSSSLLRSAPARGALVSGVSGYATKAGEVAAPLLNKTVGQLLTEQTESHEHKDVLVVPHQNITWTHKELDTYVRAYGNGLAEARVRRKTPSGAPDRILSFLPNDAESVVTQLGAAMAGRVAIVASPETTASPDVVDAALKTFEARVVVSPAKYEGRDNIAVFNSLDEEIATWPEQVVLNLKKYRNLKLVVNTGDQHHPGGHYMWRDLMLYNPTPSLLPPPTSISPDETALGYLASSAPSSATAALYNHRTVVNSGALFGSVLGLTATDRICLASPLHTPQGMQAVMAAVAHSAVVVIPSRVFDAEAVLASLERDVCSILHVSPKQLQAMLDSPLLGKHNFSTLTKVVLVGEASDSPAQLAQLVERATSSFKVKDVVVAHTASNVAGVLLAGSAAQNASNPAAGRLLPHVEAKLVDGGKISKTSGQLHVRGFNVAQGALGELAPVDKEGWLNTGLHASVSGDGLYTLIKQ